MGRLRRLRRTHGPHPEERGVAARLEGWPKGDTLPPIHGQEIRSLYFSRRHPNQYRAVNQLDHAFGYGRGG